MTIIPYVLLSALIAVESGGDAGAVGDGGRSRGCLQISDAVLMDVNSITGSHFTHRDTLIRHHAVGICMIYLNHYATRERLGHEPTEADMARIWNGGPEGWRKESTLPYWRKVERELNVASEPRGNAASHSP